MEYVMDDATNDMLTTDGRSADGAAGGNEATIDEDLTSQARPTDHVDMPMHDIAAVTAPSDWDMGNAASADEWPPADGAAMANSSAAYDPMDEDPFGYAGLGLDSNGEVAGHGSPPRGGDHMDGSPETAMDLDRVDGHCAGTAAERGGRVPEQEGHAQRDDLPQVDMAEDPNVPPEMITRSMRRKLILERGEEVKRRRRQQAEAAQTAWSTIAAAVDARDILAAVDSDEPPPFEAHATHAFVACGGYFGCVRCGRVVGWQRHDSLAEPCRGSCPRGSVRAIRRLARGLHPLERGKEGSTCSWPSGEEHPAPRRLRLRSP